ncbi:MAG: helix-turn-helix transcriptional regulator [Bacteroidota bacterium]
MSKQPKIQRVLELLLVLNCKYGRSLKYISEMLHISERTVYRYIETIRNAGFVVDKKESEGKTYYYINKNETEQQDISELLHFSKEEAYILSKAIHTIDQENELKTNLIKKLYSLYDFDRVAVPIIKKENSENVHKLTQAINEKKQVILSNYQSSNSSSTYDRKVEPFGFTTNFISVWCFDTKGQTNKIFKTSRIGQVIPMQESWQYENQHQETFMDVFRISSRQKIPVKLTLSMMAKNLLTEEYPLAEKYIQRINDNSYIFETEVAGLEGIGRFTLGLIDQITIHYPESLKTHIKEKISKKNFFPDTN